MLALFLVQLCVQQCGFGRIASLDGTPGITNKLRYLLAIFAAVTMSLTAGCGGENESDGGGNGGSGGEEQQQELEGGGEEGDEEEDE